ncbi:hypothetical protein DYB32_001010 [Aphanomyces invadans]|uniref:Glutathione peroxidase n=1 Tax=Aphanomyces invadans TaxID=157072 RepID=A0A3R6VH59_9STRA|nr:hypothetical protein DYB32_001010 [Aphanomyces invadans]
MQPALHRVLNAISEAEDGYCQGMNFIAAVFLVQGFSEEHAYIVFLYLLKHKHLSQNVEAQLMDLQFEDLLHHFKAIVKQADTYQVVVDALIIPPHVDAPGGVLAQTARRSSKPFAAWPYLRHRTLGPMLAQACERGTLNEAVWERWKAENGDDVEAHQVIADEMKTPLELATTWIYSDIEAVAMVLYGKICLHCNDKFPMVPLFTTKQCLDCEYFYCRQHCFEHHRCSKSSKGVMRLDSVQLMYDEHEVVEERVFVRPCSSKWYCTHRDCHGVFNLFRKRYKCGICNYSVCSLHVKSRLTQLNYTQLAELDTKYRDKGLQILAFPCNQFGGQEPGTNEEIMDFVKTFGISFPFFAKCDVNGSNTIPVFQYLKHNLGGLLGNFIKWNFTKFLVDRNGLPFQRYNPQTAPFDIEADIVELLGKQ